jgi:hypothetical protein
MAAALGVVSAPGALADSAQSSNWAGYAIHRSGVSFTKVLGTWTQPTAVCTPGSRTFSSLWVGIGGYSVTSDALEQIGSEVDCSRSGNVVSSAWYELVPAPSRTIHMKVRPGDRLVASVTVNGTRVRLKLTDQTRGTTFSKALQATKIDVSSAEWILEAPSVCESSFACRTLDLANFGSATFDRATATTTGGRRGSIGDRHWKATKIILTAGAGRHFINNPVGSAAATATPSALSALGTAFTITYRGRPGVAGAAVAGTPSASPTVLVGSGRRTG